MRSRLEPMKHTARTIRDQLWRIVKAIVLRVTNAGAESQHAKIQWIKKQTCGFRNAIYFHFGGLGLYPRPDSAIHTSSPIPGVSHPAAMDGGHRVRFLNFHFVHHHKGLTET